VPPRIGRRLGDTLAILVMTVLTAVLVKVFILDASYIPSRSMMDVLLPGDYVLVNKFLYGARTPPAFSGDDGPLPSLHFPALRNPRRGDILVFWLPSGSGPGSLRSARQFVKRCVAIPGDTLLVEGGSVRVNGLAVAPLEGDTTTRVGFTIPGPGETVRVDDRTPAILRELVLRDRELSGDAPGADTAANIHTVRNEFYFLLGDRTSLSADSRHWGLIPRAWVIGTPIAVYWSVEPESAGTGLRGRLQGIRWSRLGRLVR
jgi:signal peptidase I